MKGYNVFYNRIAGVLDKDFKAFKALVDNNHGEIINASAIKKLIKALKKDSFFSNSIWLIPSTGGFKTATSNNRNVVETAYSAIPTGGDPAFLSQDFVEGGSYNDCPELTKAVVGDNLMDVLAVERERQNRVRSVPVWPWAGNGDLVSIMCPYYKLYTKDMALIYDAGEDPDNIAPAPVGYTKTGTEIMYFGTPGDGISNSYRWTLQDSVYTDVKQGDVITWSFLLKPSGYDYVFLYTTIITGSYISIYIKHSGDNVGVTTFPGVVIKDYNIIDIEDGWKYISVSIERTAEGISSSGFGFLYPTQSTNGTNTTFNGGHVLMTNFQIELGYPTLPIPRPASATAERLAPSPVINNFIPETGSISMIADVVIDEFEEDDGEITKFGTTLFSSNNHDITVRITKDYLIVGGEDELSLNDIHYHGLDLEEFQRYQFGTILSFNEDMYTLFLLYLEDDSWKVRAFYGVRDITSDTHRDLFIGCDSAGNQTSVRVLNMYSTEERLTNLLEATNLFSDLTIGNLEVKKDEIDLPCVFYWSGSDEGTKRINFGSNTQIRAFSIYNFSMSGITGATITPGDLEWGEWVNVSPAAGSYHTLTLNGTGFFEVNDRDKLTYLLLSTLPNVTLAGDISNLDKLTYLNLSTLPNTVTLTGDISNMDKLTYLKLITLPNTVTLTGDISNLDELTFLYLSSLPNTVTLTGDISQIPFETIYILNTTVTNLNTTGFVKRNLDINYFDIRPGNPTTLKFPKDWTVNKITTGQFHRFQSGNFDKSSAKGLIHAGWDLAVNEKEWTNRALDIRGCNPSDPPGLDDVLAPGVSVRNGLQAIYDYGATITVPSAWTDIRNYLLTLEN